MSALREFLEAAWAEHGDHPAEVAQRIAASIDLVTEADGIDPYARLLTHVYGEHLGAYEDGIELLRTLRARPVCAAGMSQRSIDMRIATLRHAAGASDALMRLSPDETIAALAAAAAMLAGRNEFARAIDAYRDAVERTPSSLSKGSPTARALAVGGNNLACALEQKPSRSADETAGMVAAAEGGLQFWKIAGTWLEEERAEYRLARSLLLAARPTDALHAAQRCIAVCAANDAPVIERFFAHVVLALAHAACGHERACDEARREALALYERVPDGERSWCAEDLADVRRTAPAAKVA